MKVVLNRDACIGCGACAALCEDIFEIDNEGLSKVKKAEVKDEEIELTRDAIESCPTGAIALEEKKEETKEETTQQKLEKLFGKNGFDIVGD